MSGPGDLVTHLEADTTDWSAGMTEASKATEQVTLVVHEQRASWTALAKEAIPAIATVTTAVTGLIGTLATIRHQRTIIAGITGALSSLGASIMKYVGPLAKIAGYIVPQWKAITTAISVGALAFKVASNDTVQSAFQSVMQSEAMVDATERIRESMTKLGQTAVRPFEAIADAAKTLWDTLGIGDFVSSMFAHSIRGAVMMAADAMDFLSTATEDFMDIGQAAFFGLTTRATWEQTDAYYQETKALRQMAAETERIIALQEQQRVGFQAYAAVRDAVEEEGRKAAELESIRNITSLRAIADKRSALQQLARDTILAGGATEEFLKRQAELLGALDAQERGIQSGKIMPKGEQEARSMLESLKSELAKLNGTWTSLQEDMLKDSGAPAWLIQTIREYQHAITLVKQKQDAEKEAARQLEEDTRRQVQAWEQETDKIQSLKDELDVLTGTASRADIERRKALEAGFTQAGADEIASLTQQLEEARKKDEKKTGIQGDFKTLGAAVQGSREAYSTIAKNMAMRQNSKLEKIAEKQLEETKKTNSKLDKSSGVGGGNVVLFGGSIPS